MKTLKKRSEFLTVAKGGRTARRAFVLQAAKTSVDDAPRMGYTVTKKTGNAAERNRIKRRLRAAVRDVGVAAGASGADYVLIGRRGALSQPFELLVKDVTGALKTAFKKNKSSNRNSGHKAAQRKSNDSVARSDVTHPMNTSDLVDER
ncbi:ribonuclease P protein component [Rhodobacteraceae bacterium RKSG542]|uniref:ribonuclease P protein component n=1 Tax=Pseudovibrio flavus TaxID=2529854 RepID=UPI0012BD6735|nr:ribonuclease P protein component [Pseudovibrio flavus]MTI17151.1 ribonuclease P protein component [Pseudovibrio flavus]